ncbi:MAG: AbrB/MazE/SpoVT family DNA-binding domain-containing protein [Thermoprotei archaeon]
MRYRVKVHRKGIIVLPSEVRDALNVKEGDYVEIVLESGQVRLERPTSLLDLFGIDGEVAVEVARAVVEERRKEVEKEVRS